MLIISHPFGNQNVRNAALAFYRKNALERFYTTVAWSSKSPVTRLLPGSLVATLRRREYGMLPSERVSTHPVREVCRHLATAFRLGSLTKGQTSPCSAEAVCRDFDAFVARQVLKTKGLSGVYAYDHGALKTLQAARSIGVKTNFEVASGYWRAAVEIFQEEAILAPQWAASIPALGYSADYFRRKDEEIELADQIIVASNFTASNLALGNFRNKKIAVVPYGSPLAILSTEPVQGDSRKLRVLFVGGLSQAKGLSYLFHAKHMLGDRISLTVIGRRNGKCPPLDRELESCRYIPSLPHHQVLTEMRKHDVLVFPSLWDGFGLVILEALSQGIPVIASTNTGGPDVITDGKDGFIVPIRSGQAIAEKLERLANDPELLFQMKCTALKTAERYSWARYQSALVHHVL